MTYDEWRLAGPDENNSTELVDCDECGGTGTIKCEDDTDYVCEECEGTGSVETTAEDPDDYGDYLYERKRDREL